MELTNIKRISKLNLNRRGRWAGWKNQKTSGWSKHGQFYVDWRDLMINPLQDKHGC